MQTNYLDDITSRSKLYAIWDEDDDDTDEELARICGCSPATVNTYRQDYRRYSRKDLVPVAEDELPLVTVRGMIMWTLPLDEGNRGCTDRCPLWEACRWWVHHGGYCGCEMPLRKELDL